MKRDFWWWLCIQKGVGIVWTCVEDNDVGEKEDYKAIGLSIFYYELFQEEEGGGLKRAYMGILI